MFGILIAVALLEMSRNGIDLKVDADRTQIDPGRSVFLTVTLKKPKDVKSALPDFRERVRGFSLAEEFAEPAVKNADGSVTETVNWKLVPEPCAEVYKIAPFVVSASPRLLSSLKDDGKFSFAAGPIYFENPPLRDPVTGGMEADPKKDLPPISLRLIGYLGICVFGCLAVLGAIWYLIRLIARKVKEHRMSPIERAWVELDRLLKKGLPGRGRYKDFYVELTMVVRRYIQRKYGIKAPHLTTEEFLRSDRIIELANNRIDDLRSFLESADMVKFAGVEATPEMADEATDSARGYLKSDALEEKDKRPPSTST